MTSPYLTDAIDHSTVSSITIGEETRRDFSASDDELEISWHDDDHDSALRGWKLVGREKEQEILRNIWSEVSERSQKDPHSEMVNISGESGVGKSYLIERTLREKVCEDGGIFVSGKFDQLSFSASYRRDPFRAVISMLGDLCDFLFSNNDSVSMIRKAMPAHDWELFLETVVPWGWSRQQHSAGLCNGQNAVGEQTIAPARKPSTVEASTDSFTRLKQAFRSFLVAVAKQNSLVLFFDDVQWADPESLELMEYLVNHTSRSSIMYLFSYRDEEGLPCPLASKDKKNGGENRHDIHLSSLTIEQVKAMFLEREMKESDASTVGAIVFEKTQGNPFFITQFLEQLRIEGLLTVSNENTSQWEWSNIQEMARLDVGSGVLQCIDARVYQIDARSRSVLVFAAHMGFEFRRDLLVSVLESRDATSSRSEKLVDRALKIAEKSALVVAGRDGNEFCFMHDRVQQCLYEMVSEGTLKETMHLNMGRRLRASAFIGDDSVMLLAVHSMNAGREHIKENSEKLSLAKLNRRTSQRAASKSSFSAAAHFLRIALELLDETTMWEEHYELTLDLHVSLASVSCNCGKFEEVDRMVDTVSSNARDVVDKLPVLQVRLTTLALQGKADGLAAAHSLLDDLGEPLDRNPSMLKLLFRLLRTRAMTRRRSNASFRGLPIMGDKKQIAIQKILYKMVVVSFMAGNEVMLLLLLDKMLRISLRYGRSLSTPPAIAGFGMVESIVFGNFKEGCRLGDLAMRMIEEPDMREASAVTICVAHNVVLQWRDPLQACLDPLYRGFVDGLRSGDTYYAITNLGCVVGNTFNSGMPLVTSEKKMRSYCERMSEFSESNSVMLWTWAYHQAALNFMGHCSDPLQLNGEVMQETDIFLNDSEARDGTAVTTCQLLKFQLACHYRELDKALELLQYLERNEGTYKDAASNFVPLKFFACLTYLDLANREGGRKRLLLLRKGKAALKTLQNLASKDCSNAKRVCTLLEAEHYTMSKRKPEMAMYDLAIETFCKEGFLQLAAISAERAGLALLKTRTKYDEDVRKYLKRGLDLNIDWEADGKVEWYKDRYLPKRTSNVPLCVDVLEVE